MKVGDPIGEDMNCPICLMVCWKPVACTTCDKLSCKACIILNNWNCPQRCGRVKDQKINRVINNQFEALKFICSICNNDYAYNDHIVHMEKCKLDAQNCISEGCTHYFKEVKTMRDHVLKYC